MAQADWILATEEGGGIAARMELDNYRAWLLHNIFKWLTNVDEFSFTITVVPD
jgi:hypothetical protein